MPCQLDRSGHREVLVAKRRLFTSLHAIVFNRKEALWRTNTSKPGVSVQPPLAAHARLPPIPAASA